MVRERGDARRREANDDENRDQGATAPHLEHGPAIGS
jgi:hypothetical protein